MATNILQQDYMRYPKASMNWSMYETLLDYSLLLYICC